MSERTIAVIGGGASGALVCAQLARSEPRKGLNTRLVLNWIGNEAEFGRGLAYGTREPSHLLNVPAGRMSAFPDQPGHFFEWLTRQHPELNAAAETFVPRMHYGEYLAQLVSNGTELGSARIAQDAWIRRHRDEARGIERAGARYRIRLAGGTELLADEVVLALGALSNLRGQSAYGALRPSELGQLPPGARLLLIGTGLTMIDAMLSLRALGHPTPVTALSRHGLLPHPHASARAYAPTPAFHAFVESQPARLSRALRSLRAECRAAEERGSGWREVLDELRPRTAELWQRLNPWQKRAFYRHLRPYWDIHRHRIAPQVHEQIVEFLDSGMLRTLAARILRIEKAGACFQVQFLPRGLSEPQTETFEALIDCTGFVSEITSVRHPLLQSAIQQGLVTVDDPPFGVSPRAGERIHVVGPLLRASLWEAIAVPEIRVQAAQLATRLSNP